jgi:micrococcal nuclease
MASGYEKSPDYGDPRMSWTRIALTTLALGVFASAFLWFHAAKAAEQMAMCTGAVRVTCVVDGDTFWFEGEKIRIADIDAPEISRAECPEELVVAAKATQRLIDLLNENNWELRRNGKDNYGRTRGSVILSSGNLADVMIAEGVARPWKGRRESWC